VQCELYILTDVAVRSAVSSLADAHVARLVDGATSTPATARVRPARLTGRRRRRAAAARHRLLTVHLRAAGQHLELGRDAREVEHSTVDVHLLETTCTSAVLDQKAVLRGGGRGRRDTPPVRRMPSITTPTP